MKSELNLELVDPEQITLEDKVASFKSDPEKMRQATEFIDELLQKAKVDAEDKLKAREKAKAEALATEQGLKRRLGTRARGFIVRLFEAICNCTHTGTAAARAATAGKK